MKLSETFLSIQGEGPMQGRPAFFIRLAGCNLTCDFCDTKYARAESEKLADITELRTQMIELAQAHGRDFMFVFTGGEPLLQMDEIELLLGNYFSRSAKVANAWFETNGTVMPSPTLIKRYHAKFVVSPKMAHLDRTVLKALSQLDEVYLKFVVDPKGDKSYSLERAMTIAFKEFGFPKERVWFQPMGADKKELEKVSKDLWQGCVEAGLNFSPRSHVWVHGKKRGV